MNRLLSILVSLFVLFLIYLWINHIMTAPRSEIEDRTSSQLIDDAQKATLQEEYNLSKEVEEPEDSLQEENATDETSEDLTPPPKTPSTKSESVDESEPVQSTPPPAKTAVEPASSAESPDGIHLVIAGNFLERSNAEQRARQLRKNGFAHAEVVNFQLSQYHTVCAGRYDNLAEARRIAKKIKDYQGIDAYVRNGN